MKKIKFIGVVNGKEYNNLQAYNDAINEAICAGDVLNASTRTEIVDNEPEETTTAAPKPVFLGVVNGVEYKTVEEYNKAITNAINSGVSINAYTTTLSNAEENCCGCETCGECGSCKETEDNTDYFPYFNDDDEFYLNRLVTEDANKDAISLEDCKEYLDRCYDNISKNLKTFTNEEFVEYMNEIENVLKEIKEDRNNTDLAKKQINARMEARAAELLKLNEEQNADAAKMNTILRGYDTMKLFSNYYNGLLSTVKNTQFASEEAKKCDSESHQTSFKEKEPQQEMVAYSDKELKNAMSRFLDKLFG